MRSIALYSETQGQSVGSGEKTPMLENFRSTFSPDPSELSLLVYSLQ